MATQRSRKLPKSEVPKATKWDAIARSTLRVLAAAALTVMMGAGCAGGNTSSAPPLATRSHSPTIPSPSPSPSLTCGPTGTELTIAAQKDPSNPSSPHSYDKDCLAATADVRFTIRFENREAESHNVDILDHPGGTSLFTGKIFKGPKTVTYRLDPLPAGTYYFRCDVHPLVMNGALIVGG